MGHKRLVVFILLLHIPWLAASDEKGISMVSLTFRSGITSDKDGVPLGAKCKDDKECHKKAMFSYCNRTQGVCQCLPFFDEVITFFGNACKIVECAYSSSCSPRNRNGECYGGKCRCKEGYIDTRQWPFDQNCELLLAVQLGERCKMNQQCKLSDAHSTCKSGLCTCESSYIAVASDTLQQICRPNGLIGGPCERTWDCRDPEAVCLSGLCQCRDMYADFGGKCLRNNLPIGSQCEASFQCTSNDTFSACRSGRCECFIGYHQDLSSRKCVSDYRRNDSSQRKPENQSGKVAGIIFAAIGVGALVVIISHMQNVHKRKARRRRNAGSPNLLIQPSSTSPSAPRDQPVYITTIYPHLQGVDPNDRPPTYSEAINAATPVYCNTALLHTRSDDIRY